MIRLYDFQEQVVADVYRSMNAGRRRVLVALSTGAGKSVVAAKVCQDCADKGIPVLWDVHRRELVEQAVDHLVAAGLDPGLIMAGEDEDRSRPVQVASVQTLVRREPPLAGLVVSDEAHHSAAASHQKVLDNYPDAFWLGLSATPCRLDGKGLGPAGWQAIVKGPSARWLIGEGFLADYDYWAPASPDMKGVKTSAGDFQKGQAEERMDTVVGSVTDWYAKYLDRRQAIVFCVTVRQSREVEKRFLDLGVPARHADAKMKPEERAKTMRLFRRGRLRVLTNVGLVDEGFDVPECDGVIVARPTRSLVFHRQACGRALRPKEGGRNAVIVDMAGNAGRLGLPCEDVAWTLEGKPKGDKVESVKTCGECFAVVRAALTECPRCGALFPRKRVDRTPTSVAGTLQLLQPGGEYARRLKELYWRLLREARDKGWRPIAARVKFKKATGHWPTRGLAWVRDMEKRARETCGHKRMEAGVCRFCGFRHWAGVLTPRE